MIQKLVEYLLKQMVEDQNAVTVQVTEQDEKTVINVTVSEQDRGRVIGKEGRNIKALRSLATLSSPKDKKISIDIA